MATWFANKEVLLIHTKHHPLPPGFPGVGSKIETPIKFWKSGGLTGCQFAEGGSWEKAGYFFGEGGCSFYIKNKLKSEIFNDKKVYKQKCFSQS